MLDMTSPRSLGLDNEYRYRLERRVALAEMNKPQPTFIEKIDYRHCLALLPIQKSERLATQ